MRETIKAWTAWGSGLTNAALASDVATSIDRWTRESFNAAATIYDKATDAEYLQTHIAGGLHRLFDGGHDLIGAWKAVRHARVDDSLAQEVAAISPVSGRTSSPLPDFRS